MPTIEIPLTTYSVRQSKPNTKFGSPAHLPITANTGHVNRILARVPLDRVPLDATITAATLRFLSDRTSAGNKVTRVYPITGSWTSAVTWNSQPSIGALIQSITKNGPLVNEAWDFDLTTWAGTRSRLGLRIDTTSDPGHWLRGSAGATGKPVLIVAYTVPSDSPGDLVPNGGSVSVGAPYLTYAGAEDMTLQQVRFSTDGTVPNVTYTSGWLNATTGIYDPAADPGANPTLANGGAGIYWQVRTDGASGLSEWSPWAYYEYDALPTVTVINPGATSPDGSPTLSWTVSTNQSAWRASYYEGTTLIDSHPWANETAVRDWIPGKSIKVPGGAGRFELEVRDQITPRRASYLNPDTVKVTHNFSTTLAGAAATIDTITYALDDPIPIISGTRVAGTPDEVALIRDDVAVPLWDPDTGDSYAMWAPGAIFFTGQAFDIPDYTADPFHEHTWSIRTRTGGTTVSAEGPTITRTPVTADVWLVDPRTGDSVRVLGYGGLPVIEQTTEEQSILHTPINGGLIVEPKRRRIIRTTRSGTMTGAVLGDDETLLDDWANADSGTKYRLVFGKVNWSVILGDYSPQDVFYPEGVDCEAGETRVLIALNWWQRLADR